MRVLLPGAGIFAVLGLMVAAQLSLPADLDLSAARLSVTRNAIVMENPHLTGFDARKREYSVTASRAVQALATPDEVRLEEIRAVVSMEGQGTANVTAHSGDYDNSAGTLQLFGGIAINSSEGYTLRMEDAAIDLKDGTMSSANPVAVTYGDSRTTGESISVTGGGHVIVLENGVRTTLMPPKRAVAGNGAGQEAKEQR